MRLLTFQANTADKEPEELDGSEELQTEPAEVFADGLGRLRRQFGLRILGGCCGTDGGWPRSLRDGARVEAAVRLRPSANAGLP